MSGISLLKLPRNKQIKASENPLKRSYQNNLFRELCKKVTGPVQTCEKMHIVVVVVSLETI